MKLKKTEKLVVSKKMFASPNSLKKKDIEEKTKKKPGPKKKISYDVSPKKKPGPKKKNTYTPRSKTAEKDSLKSPAKTKAGKGTDKNLSNPPSKTVTSGEGKGKLIDWAELGVQRCSGCNFTTNEEGIFGAHLSLCRLYNKHKLKSPSPKKKPVSKSDTIAEKTTAHGRLVGIPDDRAMMLESYREGSSNKPKVKSPTPTVTPTLTPTPALTKKKQAIKSDIMVNFVEKQAGQLRRMATVTDKQAVIQEPYLEGSSPAQTVFLFRCYHCRSYFINIQTLKDHHRMAHGTKNLTVSLVPFTDDEPPEDINKKIIVDASRIVPTVNYKKENVFNRYQLQSPSGAITSSPITAIITSPILPTTTPSMVATPPTPPKTTPAVKVITPPKSIQYTVYAPPTPATIIVAPPTAVVNPQIAPNSAPSETVTRDVTVLKKTSQEVNVQVTSSSEQVAKKGPIEIQRLTTAQINPKVVLTQTSSANQSTANKMVVLNLIPKSQSVPCSPVQIEIPANSSLNTHEYLKQIPNLAKAIQSSQEGSKNRNISAMNKAILPKSVLMGVRQPPIEVPLMHASSKVGPNPGITVISTAQKVIQSAEAQFTNSSGVTSPVGSTKQTNRKIILFPSRHRMPTSNAGSSGSLGTTLTASPAAAAAITTSAVVTCATTTSPSMPTPLPSSLAGPSLQTTVSPMLISSTPAVIASNGTVIPSMWVVPSQTGSTSVASKLTQSQAQFSVPKQPGVLSKTIHIKPATRVTQSTSTIMSMTTQTVPTMMSTSKTIGPNRYVTITPVSESSPTAAGTSLLEKVAIAKSDSSKLSTKLKKIQEKLDPSSPDSTSLKRDKAVEIISKSQIQKTKTSCTDNQMQSKSAPSGSTKRKLDIESDVSISIVSAIPKKKAHISSQTSISKKTNPNNLESAPSLSASSSQGADTTEDFTLALVTKKKGPVSTDSPSAIKSSLSAPGTTNANPLVIVRKSVGSNKLIVHTMVSANRLFQIQDSNILSCSLCTAKVNRDLMRNHLYWHFHVENRNSANCSSDHRCHYCSVIDYVISMIPKNKPLEKPEDTSSRTSQKALTRKGEPVGDITIAHDSCSTVECSGDSEVTEPLDLKISSTFSLQSNVTVISSEEEGQDTEPRKDKQTKGKEKSLQSGSDLPKTTTKDKELCGIFAAERSAAGSPLIDVENTDTRSTAGSPILDVESTDERSTAGSPIVDVEVIDEPEIVQAVDSDEEDDICQETVRDPRKDLFKSDNLNQVEKNSIYKGNFYICGFKDCMFSSLSVEEFKAHQKKKHGDASGYSCIHCQLQCLEPEMLVRHMETHLCGDMFIHYRCAFPECNFGTNLMKSFTQHNVGAHPRETVFLCFYCNANFQGCLELHKHLRANLLKYVHCPHCSVRNCVRDTILSHIKSDHPDKPRRIFVTGQMVCQQKQKVLNRSLLTDYESDSSDVDSDCMIVDNEILDRPSMKQTNLDVSDTSEKSSAKEPKSGKDAVHTITITDGKSSDEESSDCAIVDDEVQSKVDDLGGSQKTAVKEKDPKQTSSPSSKASVVVDVNIQDDADSNAEATTNFTRSVVLKKTDVTVPKQNVNKAIKMVLNTPKKTIEKSSSKDSANIASTNTDKDSSESEEGSAYLRVQKVTQTYSRQKKSSWKEQQLEEGKGDKDESLNSDENSTQDSPTSAKSGKRRNLVGTRRLDSFFSRLYLFVGNEVSCRICTFKSVSQQKMHRHLLLMHLRVFLYECRYCHKKSSCNVEMTEHCALHGFNNRGFMNLPEPDWDKLIRSLPPATGRSSIFKSVTDVTSTQTSPISDTAKSPKTQLSSTPKKSVSFSPNRRTSLGVLDSVDNNVAAPAPSMKENSTERSSPGGKISSNEDRNIFSLFSFGLESETESEKLDSGNLSKQKSKLDSSFSSKLFTLPSSDKTPNKDQPALPQRTPTPEGHERLTAAKEQYMKELHLISISKVSDSRHEGKGLSAFSMSSRDQLSKYPAMARLRSWRTPLKNNPLVPISARTKKSNTPLPRRGMLITPKTARMKIVPKTAKLKIRKVPKSRSGSKGHSLRSTTKLRHSPRTLRSRMGIGAETRKSLLKTQETGKSLLKSPETQKSLNPETRKSLLKSPETRKTLLKNQETRKSLFKNQETRKSLFKNQETRKSILKNQETRKSILKNQETRKSLLKALEKRKSLSKTQEKHLARLHAQNVLKTQEKQLARLQAQNLKSPSSSPGKKSTQPVSLKSKVDMRLAVNRKKLKSSSQKLVKASLRTAVQKKNLTISRGQKSVKKALNQASRNSSAVQRKARLLRRRGMVRRGRPLKTSSSLDYDDDEKMPDGSNRIYFSCSWCEFKVTNREHFQRHISLHNFFPKGSKMYCPYCSYTTPNALILEKHIPMHMDKHPFGCKHCGFSAKTKMIVMRQCKRNHPDIPVRLINRSTSSQKLKPTWPVVSFSPKVRLKKCAHTNGRVIYKHSEDKAKDSVTKDKAKDSVTKDSMTNDKAKDSVTKDKAKDSVTKDKAKVSVTNDKAKDSVTNDKAKVSVTKDKAKDSVTKDKAKDSVTNDKAKDSVTKDKAKDSVTKDKAKDSVTKDKAKDSVTKDKAKGSPTKKFASPSK